MLFSKVSKMVAFVLVLAALVAFAPENVSASGSSAAAYTTYSCIGSLVVIRFRGRIVTSYRNGICYCYDSNGYVKSGTYPIPAGTVINVARISGGWLYPPRDTGAKYLASQWSKNK